MEGKRRPSVFLPPVARCSLALLPLPKLLLSLSPSLFRFLVSPCAFLSLRLCLSPFLYLLSTFSFSHFVLFLVFFLLLSLSRSLGTHTGLSRIPRLVNRRYVDAPIEDRGRRTHRRTAVIVSPSFCSSLVFRRRMCESARRLTRRQRQRAHAERITRWPGLYGRVNDRSAPLSAARRVVV